MRKGDMPSINVLIGILITVALLAILWRMYGG
jgi:hypothetical protein